ncbi:MAG: CoA-binding protein [Calditrichaeota bacterium]|nr:CoA-binding protein [Calditrichota bacterium]
MSDNRIAGLIEQFLASKRLSIVGVSRHPQHFSRTLLKEFTQRGYEVVPVNPNADTIDGQPCFRKLGDIKEIPPMAVIATSAKQMEAAVRECAQHSVKIAWLLATPGDKAGRNEAVKATEEAGLCIIDGYCPLMFLENIGFPHIWHKWFMKVFRLLPV